MSFKYFIVRSRVLTSKNVQDVLHNILACPMATTKKDIYEKLIEQEILFDKYLCGKDNKPLQVLLLHQYNDIKDATQIVINHIANIQETTVSEVHQRLNLND